VKPPGRTQWFSVNFGVQKWQGQRNMQPQDIASMPGAEGMAGVGLFFQQSSEQGIFVASVTPGIY
jgi:hypothetical protein